MSVIQAISDVLRREIKVLYNGSTSSIGDIQIIGIEAAAAAIEEHVYRHMPRPETAALPAPQPDFFKTEALKLAIQSLPVHPMLPSDTTKLFERAKEFEAYLRAPNPLAAKRCDFECAFSPAELRVDPDSWSDAG